ncbi:MAG TPA: HYR domain-containing protein, partial [Mycobacteriales bacterium]|nr:HYR domain-containing protein [Mycobacteriales bacterium]
SCSPASGTTFATGATTVTCSAHDASGNDAAATFVVTVVDTTPPPPVTGLAIQPVAGHTQLHWQSPTSSDLDHIEIDRKRLPGGSDVVLFRGDASSFTDVHAVNGLRYQYTVFTVDAQGNRAGVAVIVSPGAIDLVRPTNGASLTAPPLLLWVPANDADYYNVQVYRGGTKVLSVWPTKASYRLSERWRFEGKAYSLVPGKYRWFVFPGFGPRGRRHFGPAIGTSTFEVTG